MLCAALAKIHYLGGRKGCPILEYAHDACGSSWPPFRAPKLSAVAVANGSWLNMVQPCIPANKVDDASALAQ